jgi:hypothetical protein
MLENTEGAIKNGLSRETGNRDKSKKNKNKNTTQYVLDDSPFLIAPSVISNIYLYMHITFVH